MANVQNLIPLNKRAKSEQREIQKKGGERNGELRREKKVLKEILQELLNLDYDIDGQVLKGSEATSVALIKQALSGNVKAFEVIRDTIGDKPTRQGRVETDDAVRIAYEKAAAAIKGADK